MKNRLILFFTAFIILPLSGMAQTNDGTTDLGSEKYRFVDVQPEYPGGMKAFYKFVAKHLEYPLEAEENIIEGKVYLSFIIQEDGSPEKFEVLQGIGGGCDEEALRVVEAAGNWSPGMSDGKAVKVRFQLPVIFKLPERKKRKSKIRKSKSL